MQWAPLALTFLAGGLFVGEYWPGNKQLWSPAYVMIMAGAFRCSFLLFGGMRGFPRASEVAGCVKCGFSLSHVAPCVASHVALCGLSHQVETGFHSRSSTRSSTGPTGSRTGWCRNVCDLGLIFPVLPSASKRADVTTSACQDTRSFRRSPCCHAHRHCICGAVANQNCSPDREISKEKKKKKKKKKNAVRSGFRV